MANTHEVDVPEVRTDAPEVRTEYTWNSGAPAHNHSVLVPSLTKVLGTADDRSLLDLGCGNGSLTVALADQGFRATGVDIAVSGIEHAQKDHGQLTFKQHDLGDPLPVNLQKSFDIALAAEVIEHMFLPRELFRRADEALAPGGQLIITTPYHGWLKNVALAVTNKFDHHWRPGWDYGHIKFFSRSTLDELANECGFRMVGFARVGRIPPLAMSMIATFEREAS